MAIARSQQIIVGCGASLVISLAMLSAESWMRRPQAPTGVVACQGGIPCFLTRKGRVDDPLEAKEYYQTIDPQGLKTTLANWKKENGFTPDGGGGDVRAIYYQASDLNIGRDMNCKQRLSGTPEAHAACLEQCNECTSGCSKRLDDCLARNKPGCVQQFNACVSRCGCSQKCPPVSVLGIACYVVNYGPAPGTTPSPTFPQGHPDPARALEDAVAAAQSASNRGPFATVAMEYVPSATLKNNVRFYVYSGDGNRLIDAKLDSEEAKSIPRMCMACHGGSYFPETNVILAASFLPFDLSSFQYSRTSGFTRADQEEAFRKLNATVKATNPNPANPTKPITQLIDGWYPQGVENPGSIARTDFVPPGWSNQRGVYLDFVARYCRTCHAASRYTALDFNSFQDFTEGRTSIRESACRGLNMPHAQTVFNRMWDEPGPPVKILDDPNVIPSGPDGRCIPAVPTTPPKPRDACVEACKNVRKACLADVGQPGAFTAAQCGQQFVECSSGCPPQ